MTRTSMGVRVGAILLDENPASATIFAISAGRRARPRPIASK
jgi:hypothetical protein